MLWVIIVFLSVISVVLFFIVLLILGEKDIGIILDFFWKYRWLWY